MGQPEVLEKTDTGRRRAAGIYGAVVTAGALAARMNGIHAVVCMAELAANHLAPLLPGGPTHPRSVGPPMRRGGGPTP